jgi:uncharacterized protein (DUF1778 family)
VTQELNQMLAEKATVLRNTRAVSVPKTDRLALRVSRAQHELLEEASRAEDTTLSAFVLDAATRRAEDILADRRLFKLPEDQWRAFVELLDRPAVEKPRLRSVLAEPSVFERD